MIEAGNEKACRAEISCYLDGKTHPWIQASAILLWAWKPRRMLRCLRE
jgi:hypothetical protein